MIVKNLIIQFVLFFFPCIFVLSQEINNSEITLTGQNVSFNPIQTAVPFLTITPDSRAGGMGDIGVATSPDANSLHWNAAKYAFIHNDMGFSVSYIPWLRNLVNDINLAYLTGYYRLDRQQVLAGSLRYFSLGDIQFTNEFGDDLIMHSPNEFAFDAAYARLFSDRMSGSIAFRFIRSDLSAGTEVGGAMSKAGVSFAADVSAYYINDDLMLSDKDAHLSIGADISNMGTKISYTEISDDFIPVNLRLGSAYKIILDQYNSLTFAMDMNKLLVPTPPLKSNDSILAGRNNDVSLVEGMFQSFYDAPGILNENTGDRSVLLEEVREIIYSIGVEYWYSNQFAVRTGYFHEHEYKGNRKYFTMGVGIKLNVFALDLSYLIPQNNISSNPLASTVRFTMLFDMGGTNP